MSYCSIKQQCTSRIVDKTHFKYCRTTHLTDICVGARVAIDGVNYLREIGLYSGAYGTIIDIVYKNNRTTGLNDREHDPLPDYVVVDFPHLILPKSVGDPWDRNNPTVSVNKQTKEESGCWTYISFLASLHSISPSQWKLPYATVVEKKHDVSCASIHLSQLGLQLSINSRDLKPARMNLIDSITLSSTHQQDHQWAIFQGFNFSKRLITTPRRNLNYLSDNSSIFATAPMQHLCNFNWKMIHERDLAVHINLLVNWTRESAVELLFPCGVEWWIYRITQRNLGTAGGMDHIRTYRHVGKIHWPPRGHLKTIQIQPNPTV